MVVKDMGGRVPYEKGDPFFQTAPVAMDGDVKRFGDSLGASQIIFVPVKPVAGAQTGFCHRNVAECVERFGGRSVIGRAIWKSELFLTGERHSVWEPPAGGLIDPTPTELGETSICFAIDPSVSEEFDPWSPQPNEAMNIVDRVDPAGVAEAIAGLSPARLKYEQRRADRASLDLDTYVARKVGRTPLAGAVDEFIAASRERDLLVLQTPTRVLSHDPGAFRDAQRRVLLIEDRIRRLLAASHHPDSTSHAASGMDIRRTRPDFDHLIQALLDPKFDMVAIDLGESGPKVLYTGNLDDGTASDEQNTRRSR
ncbi:MAG: hypothetical protein JWR52_3881 [Marmoricola sp.]|nr:hypothetical protein [Marmoricola sp.]